MPRNPERWLLNLAGNQAAVLDRCAEILQEAQARLPRPSWKEIEEVRSGKRSMNRNEYTLARLQRIVVALENVASDLRVDLEYEFEPSAYDLLEVDVNALVAAASEGEAAAEKWDFSQFSLVGSPRETSPGEEIAKNLDKDSKKD